MTSTRLVAKKFHGWKIVAFSFISQFIGMGFSIYLLGLFIKPMAESLAVSPGKMGWGMGIFYLVNSLVGPVIGHWIDQGKARLIFTVGALLFSSSFFLFSVTNNAWLAVIICILFFAPGVCMISVLPCSAIIVNWFHRRQGLALGIAAIGISLGGFLMPPIVGYLMGSYGWRTAMQLLGGFVFFVLTPLAWLVVVAKPADLGQQPDGVPTQVTSVILKQPSTNPVDVKSLVKNRTFWLLTLTVGLLSIGSILMVTFIVPYAQESGLDATQSALLVSAFAASSLAGKFLLGWLSDIYSKRSVMILLQGIATVGWLPMLLVHNINALLVSVVLVGFAVGGLTPIWAALIAQYFGPLAFGRVKGLMTLAMLVCTVLPGPVGGLLFDYYGTHKTAFTLLWWVLPVGVIAAALLPTQSQPIELGAQSVVR